MKVAHPEQLTFEKFSALLKTKFRVCREPARDLELELVEATATPAKVRADSHGGAARFEGFSLIFTGPGDCLLPQGPYRFEHDRVGRFELFLVPIGRGPDTIGYEVVFNRLCREAPPPV